MGAGNQTRFASGELSASYTTMRTVYDWELKVDRILSLYREAILRS